MLLEIGVEICNRLRELRIEAGYSQEELAHRLMTTQSTISKIEQGRIPNSVMERNWIHVCTNKPQIIYIDDYQSPSRQLQNV